MGSNTKKTVSFSVGTEEKKIALDELAKDKGFGSISILARHALEQYLSRYRLKKRVEDRERVLSCLQSDINRKSLRDNALYSDEQK